MKFIRNPLMIIGINLIATGIILFVFDIIYISLFISGLSFCLYSTIIEKNQKRLKAEGIYYNAEVMSIYPIPFIKIKGFFLFVANCRYKNQDQEDVFIKSRLLCMRKNIDQFIINTGTPRDINYKAVVYVDPNASRKYYVEICAKEMI